MQSLSRSCISMSTSFLLRQSFGLRRAGQGLCRALSLDTNDKNNSRRNSIEDQGMNKLERIKEAGLNQLHASATSLSKSTLCQKKLMDNPAKRDVSAKQRRRAAHLERLLCEILEKLELKGDESFCIEGESIETSFVEVSPDLRYSRVYWTLPLTMLDRSESDILHYTSTMQRYLEMRGAGYMQSKVSNMIRNGYPPRIRFIATDTMLSHGGNVRRDLRRYNLLDEWEL